MVSISQTIFLNILVLIILFLNINNTEANIFCNSTLTLFDRDIHGISAKLNYTNNLYSCWIKIQTQNPDNGIRLDFEEFNMQDKECNFKVNGESNQKECCDYLEVGHGSIVGEHVRGKHCGSLQPESIIFDKSHAWINLHTDKEKIGNGIKIRMKPFKLVYKSNQDKISTNPSEETNYLNNLDLSYKIFLPENYRVYLRFEDFFSIESFNDTCIDYLEIGTFKYETVIDPEPKALIKYEKLNTFCGQNTPAPFYINSNQVYIRLVTDNNQTEAGFSLLYRAIKDVFTEPKGNITLSPYPLNITYAIRAPEGKKIEIVVESFIFPECSVKDTNDLATSPTSTCSNSNDYIILENTIESINSEFYSEMSKLASESDKSSKWIFCSCNAPVKTYISLSNEIDIKYVSVTKKDRNNLKLSYRFIPGSYEQSNQLRIVQDHQSSFIDGYMLKIKVPVNSHLRLHGKSSKCHFPKHSLISIQIKDKHTVQHIKQDQQSIRMVPFTIKLDEFKKSCSYLFDIKEPRIELEPNFKSTRHDASDLEWELVWYIKFDNSTAMYDFELNWDFFKNEIVNEKHLSFINLPKQVGFEPNLLINDDYLDFYFKSPSKSRKYSLDFEIDTKTGIDTNEQYKNVVIVSKEFHQKIIMSEYLDGTQRPYEVSSNEFLLKIRRQNKYGMKVHYRLDSQLGDCDFDMSLCNFTTSLVLNTTLNPAKVIVSSKKVHMRHMPKYNSLDTDDTNVMNKATDFFLSVTESTDNVSSIFSPVIDVQSKNYGFNKKLYSLSFSYLMSNQSNDELEIFLVNSRSDIKVPLTSNILKTVSIFGSSSIRQTENLVSMINLPKDCPSVSMASFLNSFILSTPIPETTHIDQIISSSSLEPSVTLNNNQQNDSKFNWYRVNGLKLFSCYNFRFGFKFYLNKENKLQANSNTVLESTIGLDDIELNQEGEVVECSENICGSNGECFTHGGESFCCCKPGYEGGNCEQKLSPCEVAASLDPMEAELCKNDGTCVDNIDDFDYKCMCKPGYTGKNCEIEINECESMPCMNHGKCLDLIDSYACVCKLGFSGRNCQKKDPDCKEKCSELGTAECFNDKSKTICKCSPDYTGHDCGLRMKIDRCAGNPCVDNAECINDINEPTGYRCLCPEYRTGKNCEITLDYCKEHQNLCLNGSQCLFANKLGSKVVCSCEAGFTGKHCDIPIDDCVSSPCENGGKCIDLHLNYKCECSNGFYGRNCETKLSDPCYKNKCVKGKCLPNDFNNGYK
jgi:hypothetical protein